MRKVEVPVDISSEQKSILGVISTRQLIYLLVGGLIIYSIIPLAWSLGSSLYTSFIFCVISALPIVVMIAPLAFMKNNKYNMFYDMYLYTRFLGKYEKGVWRKGKY